MLVQRRHRHQLQDVDVAVVHYSLARCVRHLVQWQRIGGGLLEMTHQLALRDAQRLGHPGPARHQPGDDRAVMAAGPREEARLAPVQPVRHRRDLMHEPDAGLRHGQTIVAGEPVEPVPQGEYGRRGGGRDLRH